MEEEIMITPEITMHEEPGEIRFSNRGHLAVEMDHDIIPADVSITRVNKSNPNLSSNKPKPFLKIRNDLTRMNPVSSPNSLQMHHHRAAARLPPPLLRAPIPPMPRLKLGSNPLANMYNMLPPGGPPRGPFHPPPPPHHMAFSHPQTRMPNRPPPSQAPALIPPPLPPPHTNNMNGVSLKHGFPGSSLLRPRHHPPQAKRNRPPPPHHQLVPQEPLPMSAGRGSKKNPKVIVQVPPPLSGNVVASKVMQNGGAYTLPDLNITVTTVPRSAAAKQTAQALQVEEEEEIDDDEEEELELDDVEPVVEGVAIANGDAVGKLPAAAQRVLQLDQSSQRRKIGPLKFVRTADGKGYMRRQTDNLLQKAKATAFRVAAKKKRRRFFRGGNYRFDGKRAPTKQSRKIPVAAAAANTEASRIEPPIPNAAVNEDNVLSYLGIQRKSSSDAEAVMEIMEDQDFKRSNPVLPKAKKSFRSSLTTTDNSRDRYDDSMTNTIESLTILQRKRKPEDSLDNLNGEKKIKVCQEDGELPPLLNSPPPTKLVRPLLPLATEYEEKPLSRTRPKEVRNLSESTKLQPCICDCNKVIKLDSESSTIECQAVESVGVSRIACKNKVSNKLEGRRASPKLAYSVYCDLHLQRLQAHQACAHCGDFCAHGVFYMCRPFTKAEPHLFHKQCFEANGCPHCQSSDKPMTVLLKLSMDRVPMSLLQTVSKMSFVKNKKTTMSDLILDRKDVVTYKMPNGRIISSEGLPDGLADDSLQRVIAAVEDKDKLKHTTRNMYTPTKSGDTVKILQLLSLGYSPSQKFAEADNGTPLHIAASEGHVLTSHVLVQAGAELDAIDDEQNTPLMLACVKGKANIVKYLLAAGADLTLRGDDGMTCLHLATQNGQLDCVRVIMSQNNLPRKFINSQDEGGWTSLVWAAENKHEAVIDYLLKHGANPLITDAEGNIALHWAALSGSHYTCQLLLDYGCNINATNSIGETPLHIALRQDHYECVVLFLMRKARLDLKNKNGQFPVDCIVVKNPQCATIVKLTTTLHNLMEDTKLERTERIVCNDLTRGKETNPIQTVNDLDEAQEPLDYVYVKHNVTTTSVPVDRNISTLQHCKCSDNCSTEETCNCSDLSVKSWYDLQGRLKEGFDFREPPMIFECNDMCRCNVSSCHNRVIQHGISVRLQVFRAFGMGWGVRPLAPIPKGTFVCEYVGELISDSEAETREDSYLFDLDNKDGDTFCIDANNYGNIARFINHSCTPNLTPVKVFASHQDLRFPHIALFANRDIKKGEELGFDYGEKFWVIKHKFFTCHCASDRCRYSKNNITGFLREYYKRSGEPLPAELSNGGGTETNGSAVKEAKKENSPTVVIPLTKVNVKALNEETTTIKKEIGNTEDNSSNNTPSRPRRSVTRKSAASEEAAAKQN